MTVELLEELWNPPGNGFNGKRVLVVGMNYAPEQTGIAPYTTLACDHLQRSGAEVLVLAGVPHYPSWSVCTPYRWRLRVDETAAAGQHVRRLRHLVPARQSAAHRAAYEASFGAHVLSQRLPWRPDIVLAVIPSLVGAAAAARIAEHHGARFAVWVQDLMGPAAAQCGIAGGGAVAGLTGRLEAAVLRRADVVMVLNDAFARHVRTLGVDPERIAVRPNWTHTATATGNRYRTRQRLGWDPDDVVVLHSGNMGLKQDLDNVLGAARLAAVAAPHIRFVLMGDGNQREALETRGAGIPNLQFLPPADACQYPDTLAAADVLLVNERAAAVNMSLPSKLTSYFQAGVPVLGAVTAGGSTAQEIGRSGAGVTVTPDNPAALLLAVGDLMSDLPRRAALREAAGRYAAANLGSASALAALAASVLGTDAPCPGAQTRDDRPARSAGRASSSGVPAPRASTASTALPAFPYP